MKTNLKVLATLVACGLFLLAALGQVPAPSGVKLSFHTDGNRNQFHLGEMIPIVFSYTASSPGEYVWVEMNTRLRGGRGLNIQCSPQSDKPTSQVSDFSVSIQFERALHAPCEGVGFGSGGGCTDCGGEVPLSSNALSFGPVPLNKYVRFRVAGRYQCTASAADVARASSGESSRYALLLRSDPIQLIVDDDPAWSHEAITAYANSYTQLCRDPNLRKRHTQECSDLAERIKYLDTPESLAMEVKSLNGRDRWNGFWAAIGQTSYPEDAAQLMTKRIQDPDFPVSKNALETVAAWNLRLQSPEAFQDNNAYHMQAVAVLRQYVRLLGESLVNKQPDALEESASTYESFAEQHYCSPAPLIPVVEEKGMLASAGITR